jgi:putative tryptophan/tyrosine transport system substrate-binding protein
VRRRDFIALASSVAVWPLTTRAQQSTKSLIGFLSARSADESAGLLKNFREGLRESGYAEDQNLEIIYRWAEGKYEQLPALAAELIDRHVSVITTVGGNVAALPVKAATHTVPVVFVIGTDPVADGLVASFNHPGSNVTGVTLYTSLTATKRLELLHELVPTASKIGALFNPKNPNTDFLSKDIQTAAVRLGLQVDLAFAASQSEIQSSFENLATQQIGGLLVQSEPFFNAKRDQIIALATRYRVPASYDLRDFVEAGGLMSYGSSFADAYYQAGLYTGKILGGAKPGELPVMQPSKFEFLINLKAAKDLGLKVPQTLLVAADRVIE